jgi:hypothetical protein
MLKPSSRLLTGLSVLLACWLAYLAWLAFTRPLQAPGYPLVVSHPQVLASELDVIAEVDEVAPEGKPTRVKVVAILYAPDGDATRVGDVLEVHHLTECRPVPLPKGPPPPDDCPGPGRYLIPLRRDGRAPGRFEVCPIPHSPGFRPFDPVRRVYRDSAEVRAQYARISKP